MRYSPPKHQVLKEIHLNNLHNQKQHSKSNLINKKFSFASEKPGSQDNKPKTDSLEDESFLYGSCSPSSSLSINIHN